MTTILLVDDDPMQASLTMSLLGRRFGDVRRVADAADALCLIEQPEFASQLGLVISAHPMLGISGPAFVNELRTRIPDLPVLVLGTAGETSAEYVREHVVFMARPFASELVLTLTRQMLAEHRKAVA
jgi:DNA-binding NtrC family response regulator